MSSKLSPRLLTDGRSANKLQKNMPNSARQSQESWVNNGFKFLKMKMLEYNGIENQLQHSQQLNDLLMIMRHNT